MNFRQFFWPQSEKKTLLSRGWHFLALQQMHCCTSCDPPAAAGQPGSSGRPPCFRGAGAVFSIPPDPSWQLLEEENNIRAQRSGPWLPVVVTAGWNRRCCLLQPGNRYLGTAVYPHPSPPPHSPPPEATMRNVFLYCLKYYLLIKNAFHKVNFALNSDLLRWRCIFFRIYHNKTFTLAYLK